MTPPAAFDDRPLVEYEERIIQRRARAKRSIRRCARCWLVGAACPVAAFILFALGFVAGHNGEDGLSALAFLGAAATAIAAPFLSTVPAGWAAFVTLRNRSVLSWPWIVYGLIPWAGLSTVMSAVIALRFAAHVL